MSSDRFSGAGAGSNKKELHSQIGFYLLPPEADPEAGGAKASTNPKRRSKKNQATASKPVVQVIRFQVRCLSNYVPPLCTLF